MSLKAARVADPAIRRKHLRYHIIVGKDRSACDAFILKLDAVPISAELVPQLDRCMRPGCKGKWPK